jgi:hypothetical protein
MTRRHLHVEVQMISGAALVIFVIIGPADHLAGHDCAPAHHSCGVEEPRVHVQIPETDMLARRVDDEVERLVARISQHKAVAYRYDIVVVRLAAFGVLIAQDAKGGPDILALMAEAGRALAHGKIAMLAKVIAPWIRVVSRLVAK